VRHLLGEAEVGLAGRGTAIGDALGLALKRLPSGPRQRSIVLLSDGVNNAGNVEPTEAAALAARLGVTIHAISFAAAADGVGERSAFSVAAPAQDSDPDQLRRIAETTGGRFFEVVTPEELDRAYGVLSDALSESQPAQPAFVQASLAWVPLVLACGACFLLLGAGRRVA
jgi:Ca-activated chloride channel family protein